MRKQGFMKRVLGGIMAVAFGAALCFAAPVKAEAATPWTVDNRNFGEWLADYYSENAALAGRAAQQNVYNMQYYLGEQMGAQVDILQTRAVTQQYLGAMNLARQAALNLPDPYRGEVIGAINTQWGALRGKAINFTNERLAYADNMAYNVRLQQIYMENNLAAQQTLMAGSQAAAMYGAVIRQSVALNDAYQAAMQGMNDQLSAAWNNIGVAMGRGGYNYGF